MDAIVGSGAYALRIQVKRVFQLKVGALGKIYLPAGNYVYVGSARQGLSGRIARHRRLAETREGKLHWHIDYLLVHHRVRLAGVSTFIGAEECKISKQIAARKCASVPIPHFGSSDCRSGCTAHLYRIGSE
jgi:Uri superfamily endonuclease